MGAVPNVVDSAPVMQQIDLMDDLPTPQAARPTGAQPNVQPTSASESSVSELAPEERAWLRDQMRKAMRGEENAQATQQWLDEHKTEYLPTNDNFIVLSEIIRQGTGKPVNINEDFDPKVWTRALNAAIANDLLELPVLPPSTSFSEHAVKDNRIAQIKQDWQAEQPPAPPRPTVRTAMFEGSAPAPSPTAGEINTSDLAKEIAGLPID